MRRVILAGSLVILVFVGMIGCGEDKNSVRKNESSVEQGKVERIIDGDTVVLADGRTVRYIGIDTPERGEPYYDEAKEANRLLVEGEDVKLEFDQEEKDIYDRTLAYVYVDDTFVNAELVREGYALADPHSPNVKYKSLFSNAEMEARHKRVGIWSIVLSCRIEIAKISFDAPGKDRENLNGEWVKIINPAATFVNMNGFTLSDESNHIYEFGNFTLSAGGEVKVHTGSGKDTPDSLYWGSKAPIWNNDADTAYLRDSNGTLVDEYSY